MRYVSTIGLSQIAGAQMLHVYKPRHWINCGQAGPLGWTLPAALGVVAADPSTPVVALSGDYDFQFLIEELAVGAQFQLPYIHVVVNNSYLGLIRQAQRAFDMDSHVSLAFENVNSPETDGYGVDHVKVAVRDGRIVAVAPLGSRLPGDRSVELTDDEILLPGLVDTHVHVNEPGRTEWEGFDSATRAAAAGGVTTIIDMPLNSIPPTVDVDALVVKQHAARGRIHVDVGFWGGAIPGNEGQMRGLHDAGAFGFKSFLIHSGVDEFPPLDADGLEERMREIAAFDGVMLEHAEDAAAIDEAPAPEGSDYARFLASRPREAENRAIAEVIERAPHGLPRPHPAPVVVRRARRHPRRQAGGTPAHGRDLPALPHARGRGDPAGRHGVQVLPAHPGGLEPRPAVGGARRRHDRLHRVGPLALDGRPQGPRARRFRRRVGRRLVAAAGPRARVGRGAHADPETSDDARAALV